MDDVIRFYNNGGKGDIHVSRSLVNDIVTQTDIPCVYHHEHDVDIIKDVHIKIEPLNPGLIREKKIECKYNTVYFNTWYGHNTHTTLQTLYNNFTPLFNRLKIKQKLLVDYFPSIRYDEYDIENIKNFVKGTKKIVLVCNNNCLSGQSENFDMTPMIYALSTTFQDVMFVVTNRSSIKIQRENVTYFKEIVDKNIDLNEISYLSTFCKVLIGRCSGPHTFCMVKENITRDVTFISYSPRWWTYYDFGLTRFSKASFDNVLPHSDDLMYQTLELVRRACEKD